MKRLALLLAVRTIQAGPCADGSDKGSNGCCADNKCPPCTVIPVVIDDGTSITCSCSGQTGDTAHIDATCATMAGCRALISDATYMSMPSDATSCSLCAGSEVCWPTVAAMKACQDFFWSAPAMGRNATDGKVTCTPRDTIDAAAARVPLAALAIALLFALIVSQ